MSIKYSRQYTTFFLTLLTCIASASNTKTAKEPWQLAEATEIWAPEPKVINSPTNAPPSDAIVLFDGAHINQWQSADNSEAKWAVENGALVVVPGSGDIKTKEVFCDVQLHLEWMMPTIINDSDGKLLEGQARNNSGVFLQERYEVQILDSYQNKTYANGQAGAIYKQTIPLVNASRPPSEWQSYDIIFTAPHFNTSQKLTKPAQITVLHNGVLIQNNVTIQGATTWIGKPNYSAHGCAPLRLQDHGGKVSFRNIWLRKL